MAVYCICIHYAHDNNNCIVWDYWIIGGTVNPSNGAINYYTYCNCPDCEARECEGDDWNNHAGTASLCYNDFCSNGGASSGNGNSNTPSPITSDSGPSQTDDPTKRPSNQPTRRPTRSPTIRPTNNPLVQDTPTQTPVISPTNSPIPEPTRSPISFSTKTTNRDLEIIISLIPKDGINNPEIIEWILFIENMCKYLLEEKLNTQFQDVAILRRRRMQSNNNLTIVAIYDSDIQYENNDDSNEVDIDAEITVTVENNYRNKSILCCVGTG